MSISLERISSCSPAWLCESCLSCQHTFKGPGFTLVLTFWMKSTKKLSLTTVTWPPLRSSQSWSKFLLRKIKRPRVESHNLWVVFKFIFNSPFYYISISCRVTTEFIAFNQTFLLLSETRIEKKGWSTSIEIKLTSHTNIYMLCLCVCVHLCFLHSSDQLSVKLNLN